MEEESLRYQLLMDCKHTEKSLMTFNFFQHYCGYLQLLLKSLQAKTDK